MSNMIVRFFHEYDPFGYMSNFYPAAFSYAGKHFCSSEQFMMYHKVMVFGQTALSEQIMLTEDPEEMKRLGRTRFANYDDNLWWQISYTIVKRGVRAKFEQNPALLEQLLQTDEQILIECAPMDSKWSIGRAVDDPACDNPRSWNGLNYLGRILMEVRDELRRAAQMGKLGYVDARSLDFPLWHEKAGTLRCAPKFHKVIQTYADLPGVMRDSFLYKSTLADWEARLRTEGGLPEVGFWELKQEIYDILRLS